MNITFWVVFGTALLIAEMLTGTFFLLFLSLGAFSASLAALFGLNSLPAQISICGAISILGFLLLKKPLQKRFLKTARLQTDVGQPVKLDTSVASGQITRLSYQGTTWDARNVGSQDLNSGDFAVIISTDGNILLIKKQEH